eukprot:jgi/Mesvir1/24085/Mv10807-RA.1
MSTAIIKYLQPSTPLPEGANDPFANKIRVTPDGRISVIDAISSICFMDADGIFAKKASSNASEYLSRLEKVHSEISVVCDHFRFAGQGQRDTPVASRQGIIQIIQLLPGRKAAAFRLNMAVLLERYLEVDPALIQDLLDRYEEKTGQAFVPLTRQQVAGAPRVKACELTKLDMRAIKESSLRAVPARVYASVNNTGNRLVTGYEQTADYRRDQGLTKRSQATRDTFTDGMSAVMSLFHDRHRAMVGKGSDPEEAARRILEKLGPGLGELGYYEEAREYRGLEFAGPNKRLMDANRCFNREGRARLAA